MVGEGSGELMMAQASWWEDKTIVQTGKAQLSDRNLGLQQKEGEAQEGIGGEATLPCLEAAVRATTQTSPLSTKTWLKTNSSSLWRVRGASSLELFSFLLLGFLGHIQDFDVLEGEKKNCAQGISRIQCLVFILASQQDLLS